jgi:hypothetical protein
MTAHVNKASEAGKGGFDILEEVARDYLTEELYKQAAGLFDPDTIIKPEENEYQRGIVELIMSFTGQTSDDKEDIASTLTERLSTAYMLTERDFGTGINGDLLYIGPLKEAQDFIHKHDNTVLVERVQYSKNLMRVELAEGNSYGVGDTEELAWRYALAAEFGPMDENFVPFRLK